MYMKFFIVFVYLVVSSYGAPKQVKNEHFYHVDANARIVGGSVAAEGSVPYMVAMSSGVFIRSFVCGASLISTRHVLTAAHCIDAVYGIGGLYTSLRVTVGTNRWNVGGQSYAVAQNITHQNWDVRIVKNDIGILIVNNNIPISNRIQLVPLSFDSVGGDVTARVAGWGRTSAGGPISQRLLELTVNTVDNEECATTIDNHLNPAQQVIRFDGEFELCAFHSLGQGVCNGDSGSALVRSDTQEQVGVVSWGYVCARGVPDIFARVSIYQDWIEQSLLQ